MSEKSLTLPDLSSPLPNGRAPSPLDGGLNSRVPKGPWGRVPKGTESLTIHMVRVLTLTHHMGEGA